MAAQVRSQTDAASLERDTLANQTSGHQSDALVRNRDNQRRSRARRKDYIQDLEKRLRDSERAGVQATAEVQAAARKVVAENARLRTLLKTRGVGDVEIEQYLRTDGSLPSSSSADGMIAPTADHEFIIAANPTPSLQGCKPLPERGRSDAKCVPRPAIEPMPSLERRASATVRNCCDTQDRPVNVYMSQPSQLACGMTMSESPYIPANPDEERCISLPPVAFSLTTEQVDFVAPAPSCTPKSSSKCCSTGTTCNPKAAQVDQSYLAVNPEQGFGPSPSSSSAQSLSPSLLDETSCDTAASIIASMRGHRDAESVWEELGCMGPGPCTVNNLTVFQLMDRSIS